MSIVEFNGGPVTREYLRRRDKSEVIDMYFSTLNAWKGMKDRAERAETALHRIESHIDRPEAFNPRIQEHIDAGLGRSVQREGKGNG